MVQRDVGKFVVDERVPESVERLFGKPLRTVDTRADHWGNYW